MRKTRLIVGAALAAAIIVVVVALSLPLEGWAKILAYTVFGIAGAASISLSALFATTMFVKTGDEMWDSAYFRYMGGVWGKTWKGSGEVLQINACKANWLGAVTFFIWLLAIALLAIGAVFNIIAVAHGIQAITNANNSFYGSFIILILITLLSTFFSFVAFVIVMPRKIMTDDSRGQKIFFSTAIAISGIGLISTLIVAPIRSVGPMPYLIGAAWLFGVIAAIAAFVGVVIGIWKLAMRISENIRKKTVPGQLAEMQKDSLKQRICPVFVGKPK